MWVRRIVNQNKGRMIEEESPRPVPILGSDVDDQVRALRVRSVAKLLALTALVLYVLGLLAIEMYLLLLNVSEFGLPLPQCITGAFALLPVVVGSFFLFLTMRFKGMKLTTRIIWFAAAALPSYYGVRSFLGEPVHTGRIALAIWVISCFVAGLAYHLYKSLSSEPRDTWAK
jgi:hypothetical protein